MEIEPEDKLVPPSEISAESVEEFLELRQQWRERRRKSMESISMEISYKKLSLAQKERLAKLTKQLEALEDEAKLRRKLRKYVQFNPVETWASRWVASSVGYLLPAERREEWLGDLDEVSREMIHKCYPRWWVNVIAIGRTGVLIVSSLQIKLMDLISLGVNKIK